MIAARVEYSEVKGEGERARSERSVRPFLTVRRVNDVQLKYVSHRQSCCLI